MSQFEASAALAPQAGGFRRSAPVQINPQQRVIPVAELTAPPVGAISPFVAPTLDTKAAQDLEQAMQVVSQVGTAFSQFGQLARMDAAMTERADVYETQMAAAKQVAELQQRFQKGELNQLIDGTPNVVDFAELTSGGYTARTPAGNAVWQRAVQGAATELYLRRSAESQKQASEQFLRSQVAGFFLDNVPDALRATPDQMYEDASARFPWMDRTTFMSGTYGLALKQAAEMGDQAMFDRISRDLTDPQERLLLSDVQRPDLRRKIAANESARMTVVAQQAKQLTTSTAPLTERFLALHDVLEQNIQDSALRDGMSRDFLNEQLDKAKDPEQYDAIVAMSETLTPESQASVRATATAKIIPLLTNAMQGAAKNGDETFFRLRDRLVGAGAPADTIATSEQAFVKAQEDNVLRQVANTYALSPTAETRDTIATRLSEVAYDPNLSAIENAQRKAVSVDLLQRVDAEFTKIDKMGETRRLVDDVMNRNVIMTPSDPKWNDVMQQSGAVRQSTINPAAAATLVLQTQTMPAGLLDALYGSLNGRPDQRDAALDFIARLAPMYQDDAMAQVIGFNIRETDTAGNAPIIMAVRDVLSDRSVAGLPRDQDGNLTAEAMPAMRSMFASAVDRNQDAQLPTLPSAEIIRSFIVNNVVEIAGPVAGTRLRVLGGNQPIPTLSVISSAVTQIAAGQFSRLGVQGSAQNDLSMEVTQRVMSQWNPVSGSWRADGREIGSHIAAEAKRVFENHVFPKLGDRTFAAYERGSDYPTMQWDQPLADAWLKTNNIPADRVESVVPVLYSNDNSYHVFIRTGEPDQNGASPVAIRTMRLVSPEPAAPASADAVLRRIRSKK
jgi:hypothetical protein